MKGEGLEEAVPGGEKEVGGQGAKIAEESDTGACGFDGGFPSDVGEFCGQMDRERDQIERDEDGREVVFAGGRNCVRDCTPSS